jgi:ribosome biogenesis GTPase A
MTKALREMEKDIKLVDAVIYMLDARCPRACLNPSLFDLIKNKPVVYILNKSDLANENANKKWLEDFKAHGKFCIETNSTLTSNAKKTIAFIKSALNDIVLRYKAKGVNKVLRAMVVGIPNCGKSSFINMLCNSKRAATGDKPGVTKGRQWVKIDENIELLDTPGTLYPSFSDQQAARHIAYIGSINDEILDIKELALNLNEQLAASNQQLFKDRYKTGEETGIELLEAIAKKRGYVLKGGELDLERCAKSVLDDFRKGRLGRITLELP